MGVLESNFYAGGLDAVLQNRCGPRAVHAYSRLALRQLPKSLAASVVAGLDDHLCL